LDCLVARGNRPLSETLVSRGFVSPAWMKALREDFDRITGESEDSPTAVRDDELLAQRLLQSGELSEKDLCQAQAAMEWARDHGERVPRLARILVEKGCTRFQALLDALQGAAPHTVLECLNCAGLMTARSYDPGRSYRCAKCGGGLNPIAPSASASRHALSTGDRVMGKYVVVDKLAYGLDGPGYRAWDPERRQTVVLKKFTGGLSARALETVRSLVGNVRDPNVVGLLAVFQEDRDHLIVMDHVEGNPLSRKRLTWFRAASLLAGVASGAQALHELGVVHRSVHPENILVDAKGKPHLLLGSIAEEWAGVPARATTHLSGYLAPEAGLPQGGDPDPRSDIYSIGAVLYEAVTARRWNPHRYETAFRSTTGRTSTLLDPLREILRRCLDPRPERRLPTAKALARQLLACAASSQRVLPRSSEQTS